jgi:hypothetical protein
MMGRQDRDQRQLFYEFSLDEMIPADHLLRRINVFATAVLGDLHEQLKAFYSGPTRNVKGVRWPSILLDLRARRRSRKARTAAMVVLTGSRPQRPTASRRS